MRAKCIDANQCSSLIKGNVYYVFPHGKDSYYASIFNNPKAYAGIYQAKQFEILEDNPEGKEEIANTIPETSQMDIFDLLDANEGVEIIIPKGVVSPLECNRGIKTKAFKEVQQMFSRYVIAVQDYYEISFFEARKMVLDYRDSNKPIKVKTLEGLNGEHCSIN